MHSKKYAILFTINRTLLYILFLLIATSEISGQNPCPPLLITGAGVEVETSGNSHGTFISPYLSLTNRRNSLFAGPVVHKRTTKFAGFKLTYSKNLSAYIDKASKCKNVIPILDRLQFNFFSYVQYTSHVSLSYGALKTEELISKNKELNWNDVRLTTGEGGAGLEIRINFLKNMCWRTIVGAALFHHFSYFPGMDHERTGATLCLGTGFNIVFVK